MSAFTHPPPTKTATELLPDVPPNLGEEREAHLLQLYSEGQFPLWIRMWHEVNVEAGGLRGTFYVLPDFLCIGTDDDYCYTPMGALGAEKVLSLFGAVLPTPKMVDDIYRACDHRQVAEPWGPPYDGSMMKTARWPLQTQRVREAMAATPARPGDLVEGHMKNVTVSERMADHKGIDLSFYGWYDEVGEAIQGDSMSHGAGYCDYSHGVRVVLNRVAIGDALLTLEEALSQPEFCPLLTRKGPFSPTSYHAVREKYGITDIKY